MSICREALVVQLHKTTIAQTTNGRINSHVSIHSRRNLGRAHSHSAGHLFLTPAYYLPFQLRTRAGILKLDSRQPRHTSIRSSAYHGQASLCPPGPCCSPTKPPCLVSYDSSALARYLIVPAT